MEGDVNILHHVGIVGSDLNKLSAAYERLGFTLTPVSLARVALRPGGEPELFGPANRCAIFRHNFLEVLGIFDKDLWSSISKEHLGPFNLDPVLNRYEGLHVMHFGADDVNVVRDRLVKQSMPCSEIKYLRRNVDTLEGERMMCAKTVQFPMGSNPEGLIQIAQHVTPELVLQPRYMNHRNRAIDLTECIVCVDDPATYAAKYERYSGHESERVGNLYVVDVGYSRTVVVAPEHVGEVVPGCVLPTVPFMPGFTVATADMDAAREVLVENRIAFQDYGGRLIVGAQDAGGCALLFEKEGATRHER